ncbi:hypothetical protein [Sphingomonas sp. PB4P5]|uniref:hypothetical protein n=1 Tax=Parasphingomonas puruogangriensis TaxID=3096155 RepID=UPI002FC947F8
MIGSKPLASLSSTLLARKGTARPAMRPQGFGGFGAPSSKLEAPDDLGWNDMGETVAPPAPDAAVPPVLVQREALRDLVTPVAEPVARPQPVKAPRSVSVATATRIRRETNAKHVANARSAFTLRLDSDRHLKLRLASALQNRSAQLLVTEALDAFLETLPDVDLLVSQLPGRAKA